MSAQNRKSRNTAIRSAYPRRLRHTRRSSSAAVTGCAAPPCSSGSAQPRAPACGRARAGCASGRGRPRVARPSARAPHGRRGPPAGGFGHPKHRTYSTRPSGCWSSRIGGRSGCGRCVDVIDKIPYRIDTKYGIPRGPMRRLRTRAEQRHSSHRRSGKAGHSVRTLCAAGKRRLRIRRAAPERLKRKLSKK